MTKGTKADRTKADTGKMIAIAKPLGKSQVEGVELILVASQEKAGWEMLSFNIWGS